MIRRHAPLAFLALATMLGACTPAPRPAAPLLTSTAVHVSHFSGGTDSSRVGLGWPRFEGGAAGVADSIDARIRAFVLAGWGEGGAFAEEETLMRVFFAEQARLALETGFDAGWFLDRAVEIVGDTLGTLSLSFTESSYLGGAHPNTSTRYEVFDRRDGRRLTFADLFRSSARDSLSAVCEPYFRTARELTHDASLDTLGFWFEGDRFRVNDNVAVTATGVRFRFDPYEIAPYAMGPTDFVVPFAALRSFVRGDGALTRTGR